jgi:DNA-binding MarR family transcriptional regulator
MTTAVTTQETNLPLDLLVWVVKDGIIKPSALKTFLYLKLIYPDRIVKHESFYSDIAKGMGVDIKTVRSHIKKLIQVKFVSVDKRTGTIFLRSKYNITPISKRISKYSLKINIKQLKHFTEYIIAAVAAYMVKKRMAQHKKALINDGAQQRLCQLNRKYHIGLPISLNYIAKFLGKSLSWVNKYKQKAKHCAY